VSFIPPDGRFRLMSYRSAPTQSTSLPVAIKPTVTVGDQGGSFKLLISSVASLSKLVIRWQLGRLATGIISEQLHCRSRDGRRIEPSWEWNESKKEIRWSLDGQDANCCLTGLWTHRFVLHKPTSKPLLLPPGNQNIWSCDSSCGEKKKWVWP
jgi:AP-3 complex subunit mu